MKRLIVCGMAMMIFSGTLQASAVLLQDKLGVRALGMGGAYTGLAEGPDAIFYNWAQVPTSNQIAFKVEQSITLGLPIYIAAVENLVFHGLRAAFLYTSDSGIERTLLNGGFPEGTGESLSYAQQAVVISWPFQLGDVSIGVMGSGQFQQAASETGSLFRAGLAAKWDRMVYEVPVSVGAAWHNLFQAGQWSTGHEDRVRQSFTSGIYAGFMNRRINFGLDAEYDIGGPFRYYGGIEYWLMGHPDYANAFMMRAGLRNGDLTLGLGLRINGYMVDYAYVLPEKTFFETEHRISVGVDFRRFLSPPDPEDSARSRRRAGASSYNDIFSILTEETRNAPAAVEKAEPKPALVFSGQLRWRQNTLSLVIEEQADHALVRLNGEPAVSSKDYPLPLLFIITLADSSDAVIVNVQYEGNDNSSVRMTGYLPPDMYIMVDGRNVEVSSEGRFSFLVDKTELQALQNKPFIIFRNF